MLYDRQNEENAVKALKASVYCARKERTAKYIAIFFAFAICVAGIINQFLRYIDAQWFILGSGIILVLNEFLLFKARRFRVESATLGDIYDDHVYGLTSNRLITYPMDQIKIERYAAKVKNRRGKFNSFYWKSRAASDVRNAVFENQYKFFASRYKLVLFCRGFLFAMWTIFFAAIIGTCGFLDYSSGLSFLDAFVNIIIPSLSIIFLIVQSWQTLHYDAQFYSNAVNRLNNIRKEASTGLSPVRLNSSMYLRSVQDAVYEARSAGNTFPSTLEKLFDIREALAEKERLEKDKKDEPYIIEPRKRKTPPKPTATQKSNKKRVANLKKPVKKTVKKRR